MTSTVLISSYPNSGLPVKLRKILAKDGKDWRGGHESQTPPPPDTTNMQVYESHVLTGAEHFHAVLAELGLEIVQDGGSDVAV